MGIFEAVKQGCPLETAAKVNGIAYQTLNEWRKAIPEFSEGINQAEAEAEKTMAALVWRDAQENVKSAMWWLERRVPERWAALQREAVVPDDGSGLDLSKLDPDELLTLMELHDKASDSIPA